MDVLLGLGIALYGLAGSACAAFLLYRAYAAAPSGAGQAAPGTPGGLDDFSKLAIAALIGVIGTGLTGLAAIYGAMRQANTANQIAEFNADVSRHLAEVNAAANVALTGMKDDLDRSLAQLKSTSDESLARLKVALDASQVAYLQLYGSATVFFHTLRTISRSKWDEESLKVAQSAMVAATPHVLHVDAKMRDLWFDLWQRGQDIAQGAANSPDVAGRPEFIADLFDRKVETRSGKLDFKALHAMMEDIAKTAMRDSGNFSAPT